MFFFLALISPAQVGLLKLSAVWQSAQRPSRKSSMLRKGAGAGNTVLLKISNPCDEVWHQPEEMEDEGSQTLVKQAQSSNRPLWWFLTLREMSGKVMELALRTQLIGSRENHSLCRGQKTEDKTIRSTPEQVIWRIEALTHDDQALKTCSHKTTSHTN